jgi:hypothetical protein
MACCSVVLDSRVQQICFSNSVDTCPFLHDRLVVGGVQDAVDALTFMAEFCLRKRRLQDAEMYAMRLQDFGGPAKDKGRRVIDEVQRVKCQPDISHTGIAMDA